MYTVHMKSAVDARFPEFKGKVRGTCHIMALVCKPDKDVNGNDVTHCMLVTNLDVNGMIPKWMINLGARTSPGEWFDDIVRANTLFIEGKLSVKPSDVRDWKYGKVELK